MSEWKIAQALESYRQLRQSIDQLTEEEVLECLRLETQTRRRDSLLKLLTKQATRNFKHSLKEKINGTY